MTEQEKASMRDHFKFMQLLEKTGCPAGFRALQVINNIVSYTSDSRYAKIMEAIDFHI